MNTIPLILATAARHGYRLPNTPKPNTPKPNTPNPDTPNPDTPPPPKRKRGRPAGYKLSHETRALMSRNARKRWWDRTPAERVRVSMERGDASGRIRRADLIGWYRVPVPGNPRSSAGVMLPYPSYMDRDRIDIMTYPENLDGMSLVYPMDPYPLIAVLLVDVTPKGTRVIGWKTASEYCRDTCTGVWRGKFFRPIEMRLIPDRSNPAETMVCHVHIIDRKVSAEIPKIRAKAKATHFRETYQRHGKRPPGRPPKF